MREYRPYLASEYHEEFDAWADGYVNPYAELTGPDGDRNWNSERRLSELEGDGVVAEVRHRHMGAGPLEADLETIDGGHLRSDFPDRDDTDWLGHLHSVRGVDGLVATSYHPVPAVDRA